MASIEFFEEGHWVSLVFSSQASSSTTSIPWSQRGKGSCPQCTLSYSSRYKPPQCPGCGYKLRGSYVPKKKPRQAVPKCTIVVKRGETEVYSANTSTHDDRCLVIKDKTASICQHNVCKQQRAMLVNSNKVEDFQCQHLRSINECESPVAVYHELDIANYPCDLATKRDLGEVLSAAASDFPIAVQVSPKMFCVFGKATTNNSAGYCHVKVDEKMIRCCSKDCKTFMARAKQQKARSICIHVHILLCLGINSKLEQTTFPAKAATKDEDEPESSSSSREATIDLKMKRCLPYTIPPSVIGRARNVCPDVLQPLEEKCGLWSSPLGPAKPHPGSRGRSLLVTNQEPFKTVKVLIKMCQCCGAMTQVFPFELGIITLSISLWCFCPIFYLCLLVWLTELGLNAMFF